MNLKTLFVMAFVIAVLGGCRQAKRPPPDVSPGYDSSPRELVGKTFDKTNSEPFSFVMENDGDSTLLEALAQQFLQRHFPDSSYEIKHHQTESYLSAGVTTKDDYFSCQFTLLDADMKTFAVSYSVQADERSYAYSDQLDIKRDIFSPEEVLGQLEGYFSSREELEAFLADPEKIDLFFEKLYFRRFGYGNSWSVGVNPIYEEWHPDDLFLSMPEIEMTWNPEKSRFQLPLPHQFVQESRHDATNGIITVNRQLLIFTLDTNGPAFLWPLIPRENADQVLVYGGEFSTDLGDDKVGESAFFKITVSEMHKLPAAQVVIEWDGRTFEGRTPS